MKAPLAEHAWRDLLARVHRHDWVVYAKEPLGGPAQVLDYLGRYTHRVAISNERILDIRRRHGQCARARFGPRQPPSARSAAGADLHRTLLVARAAQGLQAHSPLRADRSGAQGGAPRHRATALDAPAPDPVVVESVEAFMRRIDQHQRLRCPHCGKGRFVPTAPIAPVPLPLLHLRGPP